MLGDQARVTLLDHGQVQECRLSAATGSVRGKRAGDHLRVEGMLADDQDGTRA